MLKKLLKFLFVIMFFCFFVNSSFASPAGYKKYLKYSHVLHEKKQHRMAEEILNNGIIKYPRAIDLYYQRAKVRADYLGKDSLALMDYSIVVKYAPRRFPKAFWRRGDIYFRFLQYEKAIRDYTSCIKILPKYGKVYFKRARTFLQLYRYAEAKNDLQKCVYYSPVYKDAVYNFRKENNLW